MNITLGSSTGDRVALFRRSDEQSRHTSLRSERSPIVPDRSVRFGSFAELERLPEEPPSLWQGFLPLGSLTMLWGDAKTGKSTLLAGLLGAIEQGEPFLGQPTSAATAVWLSEEPEQTLREKAAAFGLFGLKSSIAGSNRLSGVPWQSLIEQASAHALKNGHRLLIIDTFTGLADLGAEGENDAGAISQLLKPLRAAAASGLAVLFVHHTTKNGRKTPRGSGAFRGLVDTSIGFTRKGKSSGFSLTAEGRYAAAAALQLQATLAIGAAGWSYGAGSATSRVTGVPAPNADVRLLQSLPTDKRKAMSFEELSSRSGLTIDQVKHRLRNWHKAVPAKVERIDAGRRGSPSRWYRDAK